MDVVGDVATEQVIESDPELFPLTVLLTRFTVSKNPVDDLRSVSNSDRLKMEQKRAETPARIDEQRRTMPDVTGLKRGETIAEVARLALLLDEAQLRLSGVDNGTQIAELSKKLAGIEADISKIERAHTMQVMTEVDRLNREIEGIADAARQAEIKSKSLTDNIAFKKQSLESFDAQLARLREKWTAIDAEIHEDGTTSICPTCKQSLPEDQVQDAKDKALAMFNMQRADRLAAVEREGKIVRGARDLIEKEIADLHDELLNLPKYEPIDVTALIEKRDAVKQFADSYTGMTDRTALVFEKERIEREIGEARGSVKVDRDAIQDEINGTQNLLVTAKADADKFTRREQGEQRIEELKAEEKKLSKHIEEEERVIYLCNQYIRRKVAMLDGRIQAKFKYVQFRLFRENIGNDGIEERCDIMVNGIPYAAGLNSGARIMAGLEICDVLQEHYGIRAPVFVDDAEKFTSPITMNCQVIQLIAVPNEAALRVEKSVKDAGSLFGHRAA
jgi:hypothetical protein